MTRGFGLAILSLFYRRRRDRSGFVLREAINRQGCFVETGAAGSADVYVDQWRGSVPGSKSQQMDILVVGYAHCPDICPFILETSLKSKPNAEVRGESQTATLRLPIRRPKARYARFPQELR